MVHLSYIHTIQKIHKIQGTQLQGTKDTTDAPENNMHDREHKQYLHWKDKIREICINIDYTYMLTHKIRKIHTYSGTRYIRYARYTDA